MVVLNTTDVIYCWPHVDFMALFRLFRGGKFKKPSVICQSFAFAVEELFYGSYIYHKTDFTYGDCCF